MRKFKLINTTLYDAWMPSRFWSFHLIEHRFKHIEFSKISFFNYSVITLKLSNSSFLIGFWENRNLHLSSQFLGTFNFCIESNSQKLIFKIFRLFKVRMNTNKGIFTVTSMLVDIDAFDFENSSDVAQWAESLNYFRNQILELESKTCNMSRSSSCASIDDIDSLFIPSQMEVQEKKQNTMQPSQRACLKRWLINNENKPFPTRSMKNFWAREFKLPYSTIDRFFINARRRILHQ